jgi:nucleoside-diphosphate-sugar epimerase
LRRVLAGEAVIGRTNDRFVNQIHRDDAAAALFFLATRPDVARGKVFNVTDDQPLPLSECYEWLSQQTNRALATGDAAPLPRKRGDSNKRVSNAKLKEFGWAPKYASFVSGMSRSVLPSWRSERS